VKARRLRGVIPPRSNSNITSKLPLVSDCDIVRLTSLVRSEADDAVRRTVFVGSVEGGLKIRHGTDDLTVITPTSRLGKRLSDSVEMTVGGNLMERRERRIGQR